MQPPLFCAALQNRLTTCLCHHKTPMQICSSYRWAVTQHQSSLALLRAKCNPHCSVQLCRTGSQLACVTTKHTYEDLLFIQVCSDPTQGFSSTAQGNMQPPLFSAALQNRLTACLCHHRHTCEDLLFIQVGSDPTPGLSSTAQGKMQPPLFCAALQNRLTTCLCHHKTPMQICSSYRWAVTQHQSSLALLRAKCNPHCSVLLCKTGSQHACVTTKHLCRFALHTGGQ